MLQPGLYDLVIAKPDNFFDFIRRASFIIEKNAQKYFFPIVVPENNFNFGENSSLRSIKEQDFLVFASGFCQERTFFSWWFFHCRSSLRGYFW